MTVRTFEVLVGLVVATATACSSEAPRAAAGQSAGMTGQGGAAGAGGAGAAGHGGAVAGAAGTAGMAWAGAGASSGGAGADQVGGPTLEPGVTDPDALGKTDLGDVVFTAFSQVPTSEQDPQVLDLAPDLLARAWQRWDRWGLMPSDYDFGYTASCKSLGVLFVAGSTASALFSDEVSADELALEVSRDATGQPVLHPELSAIASKDAYRGSLASPAYRQRLIDIGKIQIDGGVDGLHFDEVLGGYTGANYVGGDEGFDDYHVADFGHYLCNRYADDPSKLTSELGVVAGDHLDCAGTSQGRTFDYRAYLARHSAQTSPLGGSNPLASDWGQNLNNRPDPTQGTFLQTYPPLVYWQQIVVALRRYARQKYGRELLISSNGIFPYVDFQTIGLYDGNHDGPGATEFDWVPVTSGALDGSVSFKDELESLKARSKQMVEAVGGTEVPLVLFIDWPTPTMDRYYALPLQGREDYYRLYLAEAAALGIRFAVPLATTTDTNTATALGMLDFFKALRSFYEDHAVLYRRAQELTDAPQISASNITSVLTELPDGRRVLHLVNHAYTGGVMPQANVTVSIPAASAPTSVTLVSPDLTADQSVDFTYAGGLVTVTLDEIAAYVAVVVD